MLINDNGSIFFILFPDKSKTLKFIYSGLEIDFNIKKYLLDFAFIY